MKSTKILNGKFANGTNQKGNFTGYTARGERIFIHKNQMETIGMKKDADFKPFFALTDVKEIQTRDVNGDLTEITVDRLQALSVFKTIEELLSAENSDYEMIVASTNYRKSIATSAGLTDSDVKAILAVSI